MKKAIYYWMVAALLFSLCACKAEQNEPVPTVEAQMGEGLNVGYGKIDITPDYSVGISGYSDAATRRSEAIADRIYATCIAFTEDEHTILVYTVDSIAMEQSAAEYFRTVITANTGVPGDRIFFGATHSHSCPEKSTKYKADLTQWLVDAARKALADRSPAEMLAATPEIEGMNFVRHYEMKDGSYAGSNFGDFSKKIVGYATESDTQMVLLKFDREEGRKDILMVNWQAHPDSASKIGYTSLAASWIGPMRDELEKRTDMHVAYFTGASGNQNMDSKIWWDAHGLSWKQYGKKLAKMAAAALPQLEKVASAGIKTARVTFRAQIDHSWDHMLEQANEVYDLWKTEGKAQGDALGRTYGFTSSYQARAIRSRAAMGDTAQLELNVFSIGDVGFTTGTYEMFSDQGLYIKEHSAYDVTFLITGNSGYIPSEAAYAYRSYEADTGNFSAGTAEQLAEEYVRMLSDLKGAVSNGTDR